jgi:hypothetical protein
LQGQQQVAWLAWLLTGGSVLATATQGANGWWAAVFVLGLAERYVAARVAVDAALFAQMARGGIDLPRLDAALASLHMAKPSGELRSLPQRVQGALAWTRRHTALTGAQAALAAVAVGAR